MPPSTGHLFLIDGSSYLFRAYHALPALTRKSDGLPVGALAGFCAMLWKIISSGDPTRASTYPSHSAVLFDTKAPTFRKALYGAYKAHRPPPPEDLRPQFALVQAAVRAFNLPCLALDGYEADDLIATYTALARKAGLRVSIIASDKDLLQLVAPDVVVIDTMQNKRFEEKDVEEKFGVPPAKLPIVQALVGDPSDNVPGVPGIGLKTAAKLVQTHAHLEEILEKAPSFPQKRLRESLCTHAAQARLSLQLVTLVQDLPPPLPLEALALEAIRPTELIGFLKTMELPSLFRRVARALESDPDTIAPILVEIPDWVPVQPSSTERNSPEEADPESSQEAEPQTGLDQLLRHLRSLPFSYDSPQLLTTTDSLDSWISRARARGFLALTTQTTGGHPLRTTLRGMSLALAPGEVAVIPLPQKEEVGSLFPSSFKALEQLQPLLEDPSCLKIGHNLKESWHVFKRAGITLRSYDDILLLSYALGTSPEQTSMETLAHHWLGHSMSSLTALIGKGKKKRKLEEIPFEERATYAAEEADLMIRLWGILKEALLVQHATVVYETLERPLLPILGRMEAHGILVDPFLLGALSVSFSKKISELTAQIQEEIGDSAFNPASPQQVRAVLFEKMGLEAGKKTKKTRVLSTSSEVLEELAGQGQTLARLLLTWRQLSKLQNTYSATLPDFINPDTGRVHTSYASARTLTGRLASSEPNLQNIPIRTSEGHAIRRAFIAPEGHKLLCADYSQIELRLLAHCCTNPALSEAFFRGEDIHVHVASVVFNVPPAQVDDTLRRRAKTVNFGILYGMSAFGLAQQLGIEQKEAQALIHAYFVRFPGVEAYLEETRNFVQTHGYVSTLFGRKIFYAGIKTKDRAQRAFYERAAINARLQGSSADLIRRAMCRVEPALESAGLRAKMLLQLHDELVFEVPDAEVEQTKACVIRVMETAHLPVVLLKVPLQVHAKAAQNWEEAH